MVLMTVFNTILYDGIGDFYHFEDVMEALLTNERFKAVKFIAFIHFDNRGSKKNFEYIENRLNNGLRHKYPQRIQIHFGDMDFHDKLRQSPQLQAALAKAIKGIIISFDGEKRSLTKCYTDYCPPLYNIPFIYITEHEMTEPVCPQEGRGVSYDTRVLGLYDGLDKYIFAKYTNDEEIKENHIYLAKNNSDQWKIIYYLKSTNGEVVKGRPDLNHDPIENILNYLDDKAPLKYNAKKAILKSAYCSCKIDHEIPDSVICGIKLKAMTRLEPQQAFGIVEAQEPEFANQVLKSTSSVNLNQLIKNNLIIPVYLNNTKYLMYFCYFLSKYTLATKKDNTPKNVVIYLSGCRIESKEDSVKLINQIDLDAYAPQFQSDSIVCESLTDKQNVITIPCPDYTIRIFSGFFLNDTAYNALYQLAHVALPSGDNTLERCISMDIVLPFYWSTNHSSNKWKTELALNHITQRADIPLSDEARHSFKLFFDTSKRWATIGKPFRYKDNINFLKMIEEWPIIVDYLRQHKNFYHHLENIISHRLSQEVIHECEYAINDEPDDKLLETNELLEDAATTIAAQEKHGVIIEAHDIPPPSSEMKNISPPNLEPLIPQINTAPASKPNDTEDMKKALQDFCAQQKAHLNDRSKLKSILCFQEKAEKIIFSDNITPAEKIEQLKVCAHQEFSSSSYVQLLFFRPKKTELETEFIKIVDTIGLKR